ncbi:MAG TPA: NUDIX domain-containing protein [Candidatus Saccharimonadales bacterium]|nr:NUDIX domain-containing protein [Candidatus Saccharimonadales bacterium]
MNRRLAVRGIVMHDGKLLCAQLKPYNEFISGGHWCVPGGGVDEGEDIIAALHREMIEETAIEPVIGELLFVQQFEHGGSEHLEFFFHITNGADYLNIDLAKTSHGVEEIEQIAFIDASAETVLPIFLTTEPIAEHIAARAPAKIFNFLTKGN